MKVWRWHHSCTCHEAKPISHLAKGGSTMPEFMVAIDHITYDAVRAEHEMTAIDLVLEGQGLELDSETRDAYLAMYRSSDSLAGLSINIIHHFYDNYSFDCLILATYIIYQAVGRFDRTL
jgi:hypothetical protein